MDMTVLYYVILLCKVFHCYGVCLQEQLEHVIKTRRESLGEHELPQTRRSEYNSILGTPFLASHLPEAEAILPAHTLIRPALGMLKSAIKFPHKDPDNGAGVYGNVAHLGIRYHGQNQRVLYSGFRRALADYVMIAPVKSKNKNQKFVVSSTVLDLDNEKDYNNNLLRLYQVLNDRKKEKAKRRKKMKLSKILIQLYPVERYNVRKPDNSFEQTATLDSYVSSPKMLRTSNNVIQKSLNSKIGNKTIKTFIVRENEDNTNEIKNSGLEFGENIVEHKNPVNSTEEGETNSKVKWFWETKGAYNHIKISHDAPEHEQLFPKKYTKLNENIRNWWFYHQEDYQPFGDDNNL